MCSWKGETEVGKVVEVGWVVDVVEDVCESVKWHSGCSVSVSMS
jgi:hypothetical protein